MQWKGMPKNIRESRIRGQMHFLGAPPPGNILILSPGALDQLNFSLDVPRISFP
jgi:hypothetical protein